MQKHEMMDKIIQYQMRRITTAQVAKALDEYTAALRQPLVIGALPIPVKLICKNCGDWYGININHKCYKCLHYNFVQRQ